MKKLLIILAVFCMFSIVGCNNTPLEKEKQIHGFSFNGNCEEFSISNGCILIDEEKKFDGGCLEIGNQDLFRDITAYHEKYYLLIEGEEHVILSNSVIDETGSSVYRGDIGEIVGEEVFDGIEVEDIKENLWFELKTIGLNSDENTYQVKLEITEINE